MRKLHSLIAVAAVFAVCVSPASANFIVDNSTVQIINGFPSYQQGPAFNPAAGSYPANDAIDAAPNTDYASNGGGTNVFLDFKFQTPIDFTKIAETDRVTSGGGNGSFVGGTSEFNTKYEYIFSNDPTFATNLGTVVVNATPPSSPTSAADFVSTAVFPGITAEYVRWQVLAGAGNNGASNFAFTALPEPSSVVLLALGALSFCLVARRRLRVSQG